MTKSFVESTLCSEDISFEIPLRPASLIEFTGQEPVKQRLEVMIEAAKGRSEPLCHCLFSGPPGLGKTTLAGILAKVMGTNLVVTSGPMIEKAGDLAGILTNLEEGDVLFIDEIHRLNSTVEEYLYPAMEDFVLDLLIDSGPSARSVQVKLKQFTLAAATTRTGLLGAPLRSRFPFSCRLDYYSLNDLVKIIERASKLLKFPIVGQAAQEIAVRSRGTPRIANNLVRWVRDYAQTKGGGKIDQEVAIDALSMLGIDELGLEEMDHKILSVMINHWNGGPVGISSIAVAIGEEPHTVEEVFEPYLIQLGMIQRTPRGRQVTHLGYEHMKERERKVCCQNYLCINCASCCVSSAEASLVDSFRNFFGGSTHKAPQKVRTLIINDQPAVMLEVRGKYKLYDPNTKSHVSSRALGKRKLIQSLPGGLKWGEEFPGVYQLQLIPEGPNSMVLVDGVEYPGLIYIYDIGGTLSFVNEVDIETYLGRILPQQYPESLPEETLAAIVISARTQALFATKYPKNNFWDIDGQTVGYKVEGRQPLTPEIERAIRSTKSMVLSVTGAYEGAVSPFLAQWGQGQGTRETGAVFSRITLFEAEELAKKGKDAAQILAQGYPNAHIEIVK